MRSLCYYMCLLRSKIVLFLVLLCVCATYEVRAQGQQKKIVQFYGIVFQEDSLSGAVGAHIFNPSSRRGTSTDRYGYFSLPVAVGDTMHITYLGYKLHTLIIPSIDHDHYGLLIYLEINPIELENLNISPYMTEKQFKEAVLALGTPYLRTHWKFSAASASSYTLNYLYFQEQQRLRRARIYHPAYLPATDIVLKPLIQLLKKKKKKR